MSLPRKTMTVNLTDEEMTLLESLASQKDVSKTAIVKSAIKLYYIINLRIKSGEKIFAEAEKRGEKVELLLL